MKLPELAIKNHLFIIILVVMGAALGILSLVSMPRSEDPALDFPGFFVAAVYPGASPEDIEQLVVDPIEEVIEELEFVDETQTRIEDGLAIIQIQGEFDRDIAEQFDEVQQKVNEVEGDLPDDLYSLDVTKFSPLDVNILQVALVSEVASDDELQKWAEKLEKAYSKVNGVRQTEIFADREQQMRVIPDFEKMARLHVPLNQLIRVISGNNANIPAGDLQTASRAYSVKTSGGYESAEELRQTVVNQGNGYLVRLGDVADVFPAPEEARYLGRFQGSRAVFVTVNQKAGYNIVSIDAGLSKVTEKIAAELPAHIQLEVVFRQSPAVASRINDFFLNLLQGILLVGGVILLFLGLRNALIIVTVIPVSILLAIYLLDLSSIGLQQISIAGLVIALGLLVDNGIVVVENINRFIREGTPPVQAAIKGTSEVGWAIVSSTATTILAFFPMTQLGGGTGEFIKSMPITVIFALLASLLLALVLSPLLSARLMKAEQAMRSTFANRVLTGFGERVFKPALDFALRRPLVVVLIAVISMGGSMALFPLVGITFFPTADKPLLLIDIDSPVGTSLQRSDEAAKYVESVLAKEDLVKNWAVNVGHGNPRVYYNITPETYKRNHAQLLVNLVEWENTSFYDLIDRLEDEFSSYPGAEIRVIELKNGPPFEAPIAIKVLGDDIDTLRHYARQLEKIIATTPGTKDLENPLTVERSDLRVWINRDKAALYGLPLQDIDVAVRALVGGYDAGTMNLPGGEDLDILIRPRKEAVDEAVDLANLNLVTLTGAQVPLRQVARLTFEPAVARVDHYDFQRSATVTASVGEGYNVTEVTESIIDRFDEVSLPDGYTFYVAGEYETQQESFGDLGSMLLIAILGIFAVLVLQFRSLTQPVVVLSAIPLAFSGSVLALLATGWSFSFFAFVGFTSLVGIVVNTSIILVDYANQLMEKGNDPIEAIRKAAMTRFQPIILTTMTTILGLLPLTLQGSGLWSPMGWTIIGGMVSSTVLTLLVVPVLYAWLTRQDRAQSLEKERIVSA